MKVLYLLPLLLIGCVSPSPEAQAPVNIRVFCGDKDGGGASLLPGEPSISPDVTQEEKDRFWITPNLREPKCCGQPWPGGTPGSICTAICPTDPDIMITPYYEWSYEDNALELN